MSKKLNRARCNLCNDIIVSRHVHDYVTCKCGEISIDGGNSYWRVSAKNLCNVLRFRDGEWISMLKEVK